MKRIIDGVTYNTKTAALVAEGIYENEARGETTEIKLYQSIGRVFFTVEVMTRAWRDQKGASQERMFRDWRVVGDAANARALCEREGLTIIRDIGDMPPEATAGEQPATVYVRMAPALKAAIEGMAHADNVSVNVFALRCFEKCVDRDFPEDIGMIWSIAQGLIVPWSTDNADAEVDPYKQNTAIAALEEIVDLVERFARKRFGTAHLSELIELVHDNRFRPYPE
jgi:hypothetical protein